MHIFSVSSSSFLAFEAKLHYVTKVLPWMFYVVQSSLELLILLYLSSADTTGMFYHTLLSYPISEIINDAF